MIRVRKYISFLLVLVLCLGLTSQVNATEIDNAKKKAEELENKKSTAESEKSALTEQLETIVAEMEEIEQKIDAKGDEIQEKEEELVQAKLDENTQYSDMKKRIKYMYENGNEQFIEILCESKTIGEFLNRAEYISTISSYDRNMLLEFQQVVDEVAQQEEDLQAEYDDLGSMQTELITKQEDLQQLVTDKASEIAALSSELTETNAKIKELEEAAAEALRKQQEAAAAQEAAAKAAAQTAAQTTVATSSSSDNTSSTNNTDNTGGSSSSTETEVSSSTVVSGSGQFTNPCPGATISSTFGYRDFDSAVHKGLDLAASEGTPTYAADSGTVIIAGWSSSAGNWVVIDHGNGIVTKYMHHSALAVSAGQTVVKGQQIGYVGNTGDSYGAHLHFQVEVNGTAVDPQSYL
jgi:septal ring factor EnvC (AmiA/AmiB activator)